MENHKLWQIAQKIRKNALTMIYHAQSGHPGGAFSIADILAVLFFEYMDYNLDNLDSLDRDKFVLSKGHASAGLYGCLMEKGVISHDLIPSFRQINSNLQGHPNMKTRGVDFATGSLGQGVSSAVGIALANKVKGNNFKTYTILGDGEIQEGQVWEAFMSAAHYQLNNLCVIIDNNDLQIDGHLKDVMSPYPIAEKLRAFNFEVLEIDGHNYKQIKAALALFNYRQSDKPMAIIAKTIKGKGVSFMEGQAGWHGVAPKTEEYELAIKELEDAKYE